MDEVTPGSKRIVEVLLDDSDPRPIWIQAWGGTNTIARALKTIEEEHPEKMAAVAKKIRFYFIWEQDKTYQSYIRPHWGKFNIPTIISDQFWADRLPVEQDPARRQAGLSSGGLDETEHPGRSRPAVLALQGARAGQLRPEGRPRFHAGRFPIRGRFAGVPAHHPDRAAQHGIAGFGGWGGRFPRVRENTWLDPVPEPGYRYPEGRWFTEIGLGTDRICGRISRRTRNSCGNTSSPCRAGLIAIQNDFAARADWCVKEFKDANHPPVAKVHGRAQS